MEINAAGGMLHLLAAEPSLLPIAPADASSEDIEARRRKDYECLRCGAPANVALVVDIPQDAERRWLDLCFKHYGEVRTAADCL